MRFDSRGSSGFSCAGERGGAAGFVACRGGAAFEASGRGVHFFAGGLGGAFVDLAKGLGAGFGTFVAGAEG
jgi:hypothetical protein